MPPKLRRAREYYCNQRRLGTKEAYNFVNRLGGGLPAIAFRGQGEGQRQNLEKPESGEFQDWSVRKPGPLGSGWWRSGVPNPSCSFPSLLPSAPW